MFCRYCGAELPDGTRFCSQCGRSLEQAGGAGEGSAAEGAETSPEGVGPSVSAGAQGMGAAGASSGTDPAEPTQVARPVEPGAQAPAQGTFERLTRDPRPAPEQQPGYVLHRHERAPRRRDGSRTAAILLVAVLVLGVATGGFLWVRHQREQTAYEAAHAEHAVVVPLATTGFDTSTGTRLPVQVSGTDADGAVDEVQFVNDDGSGLSLARGSYELSFPASPIAADGTLYTVPQVRATLTIGDDVAPGSSVTLGSDQPLEVRPVDDAASVTDEQLQAAKDYAGRDGSHAEGVDVGVIVGSAQKKRDDAVAAKKAAEEQAAREKKAAEEAAARAKARHVTAASYEFDIPDYWVDRVNVQVNGDEVDIYSKQYPTVKVCWVQVVDNQHAVAGDIATSQMGKLVPLDATRSVQVWANRYAGFEGKPTDTSLTADEIKDVTDIQTGGAISSDGLPEDSVPVLTDPMAIDNYLSQNVTDTIKPRH